MSEVCELSRDADRILSPAFLQSGAGTGAEENEDRLPVDRFPLFTLSSAFLSERPICRLRSDRDFVDSSAAMDGVLEADVDDEKREQESRKVDEE